MILPKAQMNSYPAFGKNLSSPINTKHHRIGALAIIGGIC
jgi:hypothetical protein